jgi:hypothetical protein
MSRRNLDWFRQVLVPRVFAWDYGEPHTAGCVPTVTAPPTPPPTYPPTPPPTYPPSSVAITEPPSFSNYCELGHEYVIAMKRCMPCKRGFRNYWGGRMECSPCNAQEYSANEGQTFCTKCRIDWAVTADLTDCQPCEPGSYVENPSAENWPHWHNGNPKVCAKCPAGTWTGSGKYLCQECLPGTTVNPTQTGCVPTVTAPPTSCP